MKHTKLEKSAVIAIAAFLGAFVSRWINNIADKLSFPLNVFLLIIIFLIIVFIVRIFIGKYL